LKGIGDKELKYLKENLPSFLSDEKKLFLAGQELDFEQDEIFLKVSEEAPGVVLGRVVDYLNLASTKKGLRVRLSGVQVKFDFKDIGAEEKEFIQEELLKLWKNTRVMFLPDQEPDCTQDHLTLKLADYRSGEVVRRTVDSLNRKKVGDFERVTLV
jgi:hypothetical protein